MKPDGRQIMMLAPGFYEYGEFSESQNHQFGMLRAAAWLRDTGHEITFIDGALPPRGTMTYSRLKERHAGTPARKMTCGDGSQGVHKVQRYYGKPHRVIRNEMAAAPIPDEVWVGSGLSYHWETTAELVEIAHQMFPGVRVRVGGIYPSLALEHARSHCPDADIWQGEIPEAKNYWPDYDVFPHAMNYRTVKWNTGCTVAKQCSFCAVKTLEPKFKVHTSESLISWLEAEMRKGVRGLRIWASQLLQPPAAFAELMDQLHYMQMKHNVKLHVWASEGIQPSLFTPDMAHRMVRAGFATITIPMESINEETLKAFNKPSEVNDYFRAVQIAKDAGFSWIGSFIMIGTPQQKLEELVQAIVDCWFRRVTPTLMKYTIIPGSQDWETDAWIHEGRGLEELHPSLWRGSRPDLTVLELEEVVAIARMGYDRWSQLPKHSQPFMFDDRYRSSSRVDDLFVEYCRRYGLMKAGRFTPICLATPHEPPQGVEAVSHNSMLNSFGHTDAALVS